MPPEPCPLCDHLDAAIIHRDAARHFLRCPRCALVFVPRHERPTVAAEKSRYDKHRNSPADDGHRRFLAPLVEAVLKATAPDAEGLDFGCGPAPVLATMLTAVGRRVTGYDPFYAPNASVWSRSYDFIVASEVFEHLHRPAAELDRLFAALRPAGLLAVMTSFLPPAAADFAAWHYLRDPTHVCFFSPEVFDYIAHRWRVAACFPAPHVAVLRRP